MIVWQLAIVAVLITLPCNSFATEYAGKSKRLNINISQEGVNRISVAQDRIYKVVGNESEYFIEGDNSSGEIFISTNLAVGQVSPITIVTEKGFVQDVNLKVLKSKEPDSIVIKKPVIKTKVVAKKKRDIKSEAIDVIKEVSQGKTRDYTYRRVRIKSLSKLKEKDAFHGYKGLIANQVKVTKISEYSNRNFRVLKYEYDSSQKESYMLKGKTFVQTITKLFPRAISTAVIGNTILVVSHD